MIQKRILVPQRLRRPPATGWSWLDRRFLREHGDYLSREAGLAVLTGAVALGGAVIKQTAASPQLLRHRGRAVVFKNHDDLLARIDSLDLDVRAEDILVLQ